MNRGGRRSPEGSPGPMVAGAMGGAMGGAIGGAGMNMASAQQDAYQVEDCVSTQLFHTSPAFI